MAEHPHMSNPHAPHDVHYMWNGVEVSVIVVVIFQKVLNGNDIYFIREIDKRVIVYDTFMNLKRPLLIVTRHDGPFLSSVLW